MSNQHHKQLPVLDSDDTAETFVETSDLTQYDLSKFTEVQFEFEAKSTSLTMRLPQSLLAAVKNRAQDEGIPYTRYIRMVLEQAIARA
ncbi:MAG: BrnA antitoxin family protein [Pseudomonadota bacterium]